MYRNICSHSHEKKGMYFLYQYYAHFCSRVKAIRKKLETALIKHLLFTNRIDEIVKWTNSVAPGSYLVKSVATRPASPVRLECCLPSRSFAIAELVSLRREPSKGPAFLGISCTDRLPSGRTEVCTAGAIRKTTRLSVPCTNSWRPAIQKWKIQLKCASNWSARRDACKANASFVFSSFSSTFLPIRLLAIEKTDV